MRLSFGAHTVEVGNEDKVFFPDNGITKGDLVRYYEKVAETMLPYVEGLEEVGLTPFLMTSGSRGYHLWVPLDGKGDFDAVRRFARDVARLVVARDPDSFTIEARKEK